MNWNVTEEMKKDAEKNRKDFTQAELQQTMLNNAAVTTDPVFVAAMNILSGKVSPKNLYGEKKREVVKESIQLAKILVSEFKENV